MKVYGFTLIEYGRDPNSSVATTTSLFLNKRKMEMVLDSIDYSKFVNDYEIDTFETEVNE